MGKFWSGYILLKPTIVFVTIASCWVFDVVFTLRFNVIFDCSTYVNGTVDTTPQHVTSTLRF